MCGLIFFVMLNVPWRGGGLNLWVGLKNVFFKLKYTYFAVQHSLNPLMIRQHQLHCQMSHSMIYGVSFDVVGIGIQVNLKLGKCNILNILVRNLTCILWINLHPLKWITFLEWNENVQRPQGTLVKNGQ